MDPCKSLLAEGFGQGNGKGNGAKKFRLKPTLHRDELALTPFVAGQIVEGSISGASVNTTTTPVAGADVWLENVGSPFAKPSSSLVNVNNVVGSTTSDSNGDFEFCPTGPGTYEVASDAAGVGSGSDATITTGVSVTSGAGVNSLMIPLVAAGKATGFKAEFDSDGMTGAAVVYGGAQSDNGSNAGTSFAQVPFLDGTAPNPSVTTSPSGCGGKCSNSAPACACVTLAVPNDGPVIGSAGGSYTLDSENLAVDGRAAACSNGAGESLITDPSGAPPTSPTLSFTGCP